MTNLRNVKTHNVKYDMDLKLTSNNLVQFLCIAVNH